MGNSTAVVEYKPDVPVAYGKREELAALVDRMRVMLNVPDAGNEVMYRAAQICMAYRLMPGVHVHVYKIGGQYVVDVGVDAWKLEAKRQCEKVGDTFMIPTPVDMTPEQVQAERGELYHPDDRGAIATIYRRSENLLAQEIGMPYTGTSAKGFWRAKAHFKDEYVDNRKTGKKVWQPDTVPSGATAQDVAARRAIKKVIKMAFAMDLETVDDAKFETKSYDLLAQRITSHEREKVLDRKHNALPPPKEDTRYMDSLLVEDEPISAPLSDEEYAQELMGFAQGVIEGEVVEDDPIEEKAPVTPLGSILQDIYEDLPPLAKKYSEVIRQGELDEAGNRIGRVGGDEEADEDRKKTLRSIINKLCGWSGNEEFAGAIKSDLLLAVMGGKWADGLSLSTGAAAQMRKDLPENLKELGMNDKKNPHHSAERCGIIKKVGESIDQLPKEPA